jgi:hypothetical protein
LILKDFCGEEKEFIVKFGMKGNGWMRFGVSVVEIDSKADKLKAQFPICIDLIFTNPFEKNNSIE